MYGVSCQRYFRAHYYNVLGQLLFGPQVKDLASTGIFWLRSLVQFKPDIIQPDVI